MRDRVGGSAVSGGAARDLPGVQSSSVGALVGVGVLGLPPRARIRQGVRGRRASAARSSPTAPKARLSQ
jgi:hypothetical protein